MAGASFQVPSLYRGRHRWRARSTQSDPALLARHRGSALPVPRVAQHENRPDRAPKTPAGKALLRLGGNLAAINTLDEAAT